VIKPGALERLRYSLGKGRRPVSLAGLLRLWWADFVIHPLSGCGEHCQDCGRRYVLWRAPDDLYAEVHGSGSGLLCPACFSRQADAKGVTVCFAAGRWPWWDADGETKP